MGGENGRREAASILVGFLQRRQRLSIKKSQPINLSHVGGRTHGRKEREERSRVRLAVVSLS
jgi:hypothetical protein